MKSSSTHKIRADPLPHIIHNLAQQLHNFPYSKIPPPSKTKMVRRKERKRSRRDKSQRGSDSSSSFKSFIELGTPASSPEMWKNLQGKTVHWNALTHRYTRTIRRGRRRDSFIETDSLASSSLRSQQNANFFEDDRHSLFRSKRRIQQTFSRWRRSSIQ